MKKLCALLLCLCLMAPAALADVIVELDDSFWRSRQDECDYLFRRYTANGAEGYVTLWESPVSSRQLENVPNGETLAGNWHYTDGRGVTWLAAEGEGYDEVRGWVKVSDCAAAPDYLSFEEAHGEEFVPYDPAYDHAFDGLETVVLWRYPGSGVAEWEEADARWFRENTTPAQDFQSCWEDGAGRVWAFVGYCYGMRNTWVCLSDPADPSLPADPTVLPDDTVWYPAAETLPAPSNGVPALAVALVVVAVGGAAALIPVVCRKKKRGT